MHSFNPGRRDRQNYVHCYVEAHTAFGEAVRRSLQLRDRPMVAVTEHALRAVCGYFGLGLNQIISCRYEISKVDRCSLQLGLSIGWFQLTDECNKRVRDPAGCPVLQPFDDARLGPLATPDGLPLEAGETVRRKPDRGDVIRVNRHPQAFVGHRLSFVRDEAVPDFRITRNAEHRPYSIAHHAVAVVAGL